MFDIVQIGEYYSLNIFTDIDEDGYDALSAIIYDENDVEIASMDDIDLCFSPSLTDQLSIEEKFDAFYKWCSRNTKLILKWLLRNTVGKVIDLIQSAIRSIKKDKKSGNIVAYFSGIFTTIFKVAYKVISFAGKVISFFKGLFGIFSLCFA